MTEKPENTHPHPGSHSARIEQLETAQRGKKDATLPKGKATPTSVADKLADALLAARRDRATNSGQDPALADFREELFSKVRKLIPKAIEQAEKGKPALLRILCRYTR